MHRTPNDIKISGFEHIVYDSLQKEYYNTRTDIFLTDDDIMYLSLRPYTHIVSPLPSSLPQDYFTSWENL